MDLSYLESGMVHCQFQVYGDENVKMSSEQYDTCQEYMGVKAGLALYRLQSLYIIPNSTLKDINANTIDENLAVTNACFTMSLYSYLTHHEEWYNTNRVFMTDLQICFWLQQISNIINFFFWVFRVQHGKYICLNIKFLAPFHVFHDTRDVSMIPLM